MLPWLITTTAGPALTARVAAATARVVVDPVLVGGATTAALVFAVALRRRGLVRRRPGGRPT